MSSTSRPAATRSPRERPSASSISAKPARSGLISIVLLRFANRDKPVVIAAWGDRGAFVIRALARGRVVAAQRCLVKAALLLVLASGCFYLDPINNRPPIGINPC